MTSQTENNDGYIRQLHELKARDHIDDLDLRLLVVWLADVLGVIV